MLCMQGASFTGTQKRLHKTNPGDYVTWNTGQRAESHRKKTILLCEMETCPCQQHSIWICFTPGSQERVIKSRVKATGNFSDEETSLAQLSHSHWAARDGRGVTRTRSELLETVKQEPPVQLEEFSAAQDVSFIAKWNAHPLKPGDEVSAEGREML